MTNLHDVLAKHVRSGSIAGAAGLIAHGDRIEVQAAGFLDVEGAGPMTRESIFRIASVTKPIVAAAVMMLVDDGRIALDDPIDPWLPELAAPMVVREPAGPIDDVVPSVRAITLYDVMTSRAGYGFPDDFSLPAVEALFTVQFGPLPAAVAEPDKWMATLASIPLLHQPGEAWLYNTCSDLQGVLIARVTGGTLPDFLAERIFEPLGMVDTGFFVPAAKRDRFTSLYRASTTGGLDLVDEPDGQWSTPPAFPSGAGGLVSTLDDWYAFGRMLLADGEANGRRLLSAKSIDRMTTDHLTAAQRDAGQLFIEGQGWGFGGSVDVAELDAWNVPGRYGWVGGTGTSAHVTPSTGAVAIMFSQLEMTGPTPPTLMRDFWTYAAAF